MLSVKQSTEGWLRRTASPARIPVCQRKAGYVRLRHRHEFRSVNGRLVTSDRVTGTDSGLSTESWLHRTASPARIPVCQRKAGYVGPRHRHGFRSVNGRRVTSDHVTGTDSGLSTEGWLRQTTSSERIPVCHWKAGYVRPRHRHEFRSVNGRSVDVCHAFCQDWLRTRMPASTMFSGPTYNIYFEYLEILDS